jgi:hypothetical protein
MWALLEIIVIIAIVLIFITEFFIPILTGKPLFGSFRKSKNETIDNDDLDEKITKAKEKVDEVKTVQTEVTEHFKTAEQLKEESDNLLK